MRFASSSRASRSGSFVGCKAWLNEGIVRWTLLWIGLVLAALAVGFGSGCTRTILVPEASPIRIGPRTEARVYVRDGGEWVLGSNSVTIPEGWYCVPPSYVDEEK